MRIEDAKRYKGLKINNGRFDFTGIVDTSGDITFTGTTNLTSSVTFDGIPLTDTTTKELSTVLEDEATKVTASSAINNFTVSADSRYLNYFNERPDSTVVRIELPKRPLFYGDVFSMDVYLTLRQDFPEIVLPFPGGFVVSVYYDPTMVEPDGVSPDTDSVINSKRYFDEIDFAEDNIIVDGGGAGVNEHRAVLQTLTTSPVNNIEPVRQNNMLLMSFRYKVLNTIGARITAPIKKVVINSITYIAFEYKASITYEVGGEKVAIIDDIDGEEEKLENGKIVCANFLEVSEIQTKAEGIGANSLFYDEVDPLSSQLNRIKVSTT